MIGWEIIGGAIVAAFVAGLGLMRTWLKRGQKAEKADAYIKTDKAVDAARGSLDASDNREWLRKRGERKP